MLQPVLVTSRLRLVPLGEAHLSDECALNADPDVMRFVGAGRPRSVAEVAVAHQERMNRAAFGLGFWAGFTEDVFVGWWLLTPAEGDQRGGAELGYRLHQGFWRRGLAVEGPAALLDYGFRQLELQQIFASTLTINTGSRAVMTRLGLQLISTRTSEDFGVIAGAELGDVDYAISAKNWLERPSGTAHKRDLNRSIR